MYSGPLPRTKLLSPAPAARFDGALSVDGREIPVEGWRGMAGHNWGARHAERWIWLHGLTADGDWLDAALGKVKLGPVTTPWVASGAQPRRRSPPTRRPWAQGRRRRVSPTPAPSSSAERAARARHRLGAARAVRRLDLRGSRRLRAPYGELLDRGHAPDRGGPARRAQLELDVPGGAAYELGMRERDHGMAIQPHPDG